MNAGRGDFFWKIIFLFFVSYLFIKWAVPLLSQHLLSMPFTYPVPRSLLYAYMLTVAAALFMYVTLSDERINEFLSPVKGFLKGDFGDLPRNIVLVVLPLLAGWFIYGLFSPSAELPASIRMQHPSSNFPAERALLVNPYRSPTDAEVDTFILEVMEGRVGFIPQVVADVQSWQSENRGEAPLSFFPTGPMKRFLETVEGGTIDRKLARDAMGEKNLFEGRALYAINCLPCHGVGTAGDGPMARGWNLRPTNFTDKGTIETVVEGYIHWRVREGGRGLPVEGTPWDSAMPAWKGSLSDEEIWKAIAAEYDMAQKSPRQLDKIDGGGGL